MAHQEETDPLLLRNKIAASEYTSQETQIDSNDLKTRSMISHFLFKPGIALCEDKR